MLKNAPIIPYIPVKDVARARKFYEEKIGLKPKEEYAGGVIYECGKGSWVFMYPSGGAGTSKASTAFWAVEDVAAEVADPALERLPLRIHLEAGARVVVPGAEALVIAAFVAQRDVFSHQLDDVNRPLNLFLGRVKRRSH